MKRLAILIVALMFIGACDTPADAGCRILKRWKCHRPILKRIFHRKHHRICRPHKRGHHKQECGHHGHHKPCCKPKPCEPCDMPDAPEPPAPGTPEA